MTTNKYPLINSEDFDLKEIGEFGSVRFVMINDECWMAANDIGKCLSYRNPRESLRRFVTAENKTIVMICDNGSNYKNKFTLINEAGLNQLVLRSDAPRAREFQNWIATKVLPEMRHSSGNYLTEELQEMLVYDPDKALAFMQEIATQNKNLKKEKDETEKFRKMFECKSGSCSVGTLAKMLAQKGYDIGRTRLFDWMRTYGYLSVQPTSYNVPMQKHIKDGLFEVNVNKMIAYTTKNPQRWVHIPMVTPKGQIEIMRKFIKWYNTNNEAVPQYMRDFNEIRNGDVQKGFTRLRPKNGGGFYKYLEKRVRKQPRKKSKDKLYE